MLTLRLLSWIRNHSWFHIFLLGTLCIEEHQRSYILNSAQYLFRWVGKHFHVYFSHETNFLPSNQNEQCKRWHLSWNLSHKCMSGFSPRYIIRDQGSLRDCLGSSLGGSLDFEVAFKPFGAAFRGSLSGQPFEAAIWAAHWSSLLGKPFGASLWGQPFGTAFQGSLSGSLSGQPFKAAFWGSHLEQTFLVDFQRAFLGSFSGQPFGAAYWAVFRINPSRQSFEAAYGRLLELFGAAIRDSLLGQLFGAAFWGSLSG